MRLRRWSQWRQTFLKYSSVIGTLVSCKAGWQWPALATTVMPTTHAALPRGWERLPHSRHQLRGTPVVKFSVHRRDAAPLPRCLPFPSATGVPFPVAPAAPCTGSGSGCAEGPGICSSLHVSGNKCEFSLMHRPFSYCICQESAILLDIGIEFLTE